MKASKAICVRSKYRRSGDARCGRCHASLPTLLEPQGQSRGRVVALTPRCQLSTRPGGPRRVGPDSWAEAGQKARGELGARRSPAGRLLQPCFSQQRDTVRGLTPDVAIFF